MGEKMREVRAGVISDPRRRVQPPFFVCVAMTCVRTEFVKNGALKPQDLQIPLGERRASAR
jgi:hypothetical protein